MLAGRTLGEVAWATGAPRRAVGPLNAALGALEANDVGSAVIGLLIAAHAAVGDRTRVAQLLTTLQAHVGPTAPLADQAALALATARYAVGQAEWAVALPAFAVAAQHAAAVGLRPQQVQTLREWAAAHQARGLREDAAAAARYAGRRHPRADRTRAGRSRETARPLGGGVGHTP